MRQNNNTEEKDPLINLLEAASKDELVSLLEKLSGSSLSVRKTCIDNLKGKLLISPSADNHAKSSAILALWYEVARELSQLNEDGRGDPRVKQTVIDGLNQLVEALQAVTLIKAHRDELLNEIFPYILNGNTKIFAALYDITYATCTNNDNWIALAKQFEQSQQVRPLDYARRIYRRIGDHKKYLELRAQKLRYALDYHDLACFYWEIGDKTQAVEAAKIGNKLPDGPIIELNTFLAKWAKEYSDRETYIHYYFAQLTTPLTFDSYQVLEQEMDQQEWQSYQDMIVKVLKNDFNIEAVKIHLYRKEDERALEFFNNASKYSFFHHGQTEIFAVAKDLEARYPEQILSYYKLSTGNLDASTSRKDYINRAQGVARIRSMLIDVMKQPDEWKAFATDVARKNLKRPAFQDEFIKVIPGWRQYMES